MEVAMWLPVTGGLAVVWIITLFLLKRKDHNALFFLLGSAGLFALLCYPATHFITDRVPVLEILLFLSVTAFCRTYSFAERIVIMVFGSIILLVLSLPRMLLMNHLMVKENAATSLAVLDFVTILVYRMMTLSLCYLILFKAKGLHERIGGDDR